MLSSVTSFINFVQVPVHKSFFTSLINFSPRYFILFDAGVNEIVFLIPFQDFLLLTCINTTDFYILILYHSTLLNLFILTCGCGVQSLLARLRIRLMSTNRFCLFPIWLTFFFLGNCSGQDFQYCLIRSLKNGHPGTSLVVQWLNKNPPAMQGMWVDCWSGS